jgi:hypothetical protein
VNTVYNKDQHKSDAKLAGAPDHKKPYETRTLAKREPLARHSKTTTS